MATATTKTVEMVVTTDYEAFPWTHRGTLEQMNQQHPLALIGRVFAILAGIEAGLSRPEYGGSTDNLAAFGQRLAKEGRYEELATWLFALEASIDPQQREGWPLAEVIC